MRRNRHEHERRGMHALEHTHTHTRDVVSLGRRKQYCTWENLGGISSTAVVCYVNDEMEKRRYCCYSSVCGSVTVFPLNNRGKLHKSQLGKSALHYSEGP